MRCTLASFLIVLTTASLAPADPATVPAPATAPAAAPAGTAEVNGLALAVTLAKDTFAADESIEFTASFKNTTDKPFVLYDVTWFWNWAITFQNVQTQAAWQVEIKGKLERTMGQVSMPPGESLVIPVKLAQNKPHQFSFVCEATKERLTQLPPGRYRLTVGMDVRVDRTQRNPDVPFWVGKIATSPIDVRVQEPGATTNPAN